MNFLQSYCLLNAGFVIFISQSVLTIWDHGVASSSTRSLEAADPLERAHRVIVGRRLGEGRFLQGNF